MLQLPLLLPLILILILILKKFVFVLIIFPSSISFATFGCFWPVGHGKSQGQGQG